jgi:hypothetical protein
MADEEDGDAALLRHPQQAPGGLGTCATSPARRRARPRKRLHRVDHADIRTLALERGADGLELGLGEDLDRPGPPIRSALSFT